MTSIFFAALGLLCIVEGILPFLMPQIWRRMMQNMLVQSDKTLRIFGLISMIIGLGILYFFR